MKKLALVGLAGALAAVGIAAPGIAGGNKYDAVESTRDCGNGTVVLDGPLKLWPPNHKMIAEPVTATADEDGEETLAITPSAVDAAGGDGGSQHDPDWSATGEDGTIVGTDNGEGGVTAALELRAERSGRGEGRTYTINWTATFDGQECSSDGTDANHMPFEITVPHDMGAGNDDGRNGSKDPEQS